MIEPNIPNVKLSQVERIIKAVKEHYKDTPERIDDIELSFEFVIGSLFSLFLYFYEALSIGFIFAAFFSLEGVSGLFYVLIYVILFKTVYIIFISLILIKSFNVSRNIIGYFVLKKEANLKNLAANNFIDIIKYSVVVLIYDIFLTFLGNNVLSIFSFLI